MKRLLFFVACFSAFFLLSSCEDDRFDFSELDSVIMSGQWNVPLGTKDLSFEMFLEQLAENEYVSFDSVGNLQLSYSYLMDTVVMGSDFMGLNTIHSDVTASLENPYPYVLEEPIQDTLHVEQPLTLESDFVFLKSAKIRSGSFAIFVETDVERVSKIIVRSPNLFDANNHPVQSELVLGDNVFDVSGFHIVSPEGNTITLIYDICYEAFDYTGPNFVFNGVIDVQDLKIQEVSGYVTDFVTHFRVDTTFEMPVDQIEGDITFADARLTISDRNSFQMSAVLRVDTAMLFGDNVAPWNIFPEYPVMAQIHYTPHYEPLFSQNFVLNLNSEFNSVLLAGDVVLNPSGEEVTISDTATIGLFAEAVVPIVFNIPDVTYEDTLDIDVSGIEAPELITEVLLHVDFESQLPFNFKAQMLTLEGGVATDSLFVTPPEIKGSFDGVSVPTQTRVLITHERLNHVMSADGLLLRLGVNTENYNVSLNLEDMLRVTLRADIHYDGDLTDL